MDRKLSLISYRYSKPAEYGKHCHYTLVSIPHRYSKPLEYFKEQTREICLESQFLIGTVNGYKNE